MTDVIMTPLEVSLAKSCQIKEGKYLNRRVPSLGLLTYLEFTLIMLTIPLAAIDINGEKAGVIARNVDMLLLIGLGVALATACYFIVERMISSRVQVLEAQQRTMTQALENLSKRMETMMDMITAMQITQQKTLTSMLSGQDISEKTMAALACHERDCPARHNLAATHKEYLNG